MMFKMPMMAFVALGFFTGCSSEPADPRGTAGHPANPDALEARLSSPVTTLAIDESPATAASEESLGMAGMQMGQRMQHDMSGMDHDMKDMSHDRPAMQHEMPMAQSSQNAAASAPQITPTSSPATTPAAAVYICPMHPDVISDKPGKCPKCSMKLVLKKGAR